MKKGVWLDSREAFIIDEKGESINRIGSEIESQVRYEGEKDQQGRFGDQYVSGEGSKDERHDHQVTNYIKRLSDELNGTSDLLIFGPADMKKHLRKAVEGDNRFKQTDITVETADSMTENQMRAVVREFFE